MTVEGRVAVTTARGIAMWVEGRITVSTARRIAMRVAVSVARRIAGSIGKVLSNARLGPVFR